MYLSGEYIYEIPAQESFYDWIQKIISDLSGISSFEEWPHTASSQGWKDRTCSCLGYETSWTILARHVLRLFYNNIHRLFLRIVFIFNQSISDQMELVLSGILEARMPNFTKKNNEFQLLMLIFIITFVPKFWTERCKLHQHNKLHLSQLQPHTHCSSVLSKTRPISFCSFDLFVIAIVLMLWILIMQFICNFSSYYF